MRFNEFVDVKHNFRAIIILSVIPIFFGITSVHVRHAIGPYWLHSGNYDPEYTYLFSFIDILKIESPYFVAHPGTPLALLGALIIKLYAVLQSFFRLSEINLVDDLLLNPEYYLTFINSIIVVLLSVSLFVSSFVLFIFSKNLIRCVLLQSTCFTWTLVNASTEVSPEPLLFFLSQIVVIMIILYIYSQLSHGMLFAILYGAILGLGAALKITFIPLLLFVFLVPRIAKKIIVLFSFLISFFIFTLPILPHYARFFDWIISMGLHKGNYGGGDKGVIDFSKVPKNFLQFYNEDKIYFCVLFLSFFSLLILILIHLRKLALFRNSEILANNEINLKYLKVSCVLLCISFLQLFGYLKQPAIDYMVPSMGLSGLLLVSQFHLVKMLIVDFFDNVKNAYFCLFLLIGFYSVFLFHNATTYIDGNYRYFEKYYDEYVQASTFLEKNYNQCTIVTSYDSSDPIYALKFGNETDGSRYSKELNEIYPGHIFFNNGIRGFEDFNTGWIPENKIEITPLIENSCLIFFGSTFPDNLLKGIKVEPLYLSEHHNIYQFLPDS